MVSPKLNFILLCRRFVNENNSLDFLGFIDKVKIEGAMNAETAKTRLTVVVSIDPEQSTDTFGVDLVIKTPAGSEVPLYKFMVGAVSNDHPGLFGQEFEVPTKTEGIYLFKVYHEGKFLGETPLEVSFGEWLID